MADVGSVWETWLKTVISCATVFSDASGAESTYLSFIFFTRAYGGELI